MTSKSIEIPMLTRVEGEGALSLEIKDNHIHKLQLKIFEPPRLFEKFLEGRGYDEVLDFVARICGICPVAYQMSAVHALESAFGIAPGPWVRTMRRLFYCGEWLSSHNLHIHLLAAPDFLGYETAFAMAKDFPEEVKRGLRLQSLGNKLIKLFGARSVHPVGACVGGFYRAPSLSEVKELLVEFPERLKEAEDLLHWTASLPFPDEQQDFIYVSLRHPNEYPMNEGNIVSNKSLDIAIADFENHFREYQVPYSTALHCMLQDKPYLVGPLARVNLNYDKLPQPIKQVVAQVGFNFPSHNMFHSVVARAIEVYYAVIEAKRILESYVYPSQSLIAASPRAAVGFGCTEAPRGLLWQRYEIDDKGLVKSARIVPPTSQNQARMEQDLYTSLPQYGLNRSDRELRLHSEMVIRNYDPCISCSTHFLDLGVNRL